MPHCCYIYNGNGPFLGSICILAHSQALQHDINNAESYCCAGQMLSETHSASSSVLVGLKKIDFGSIFAPVLKEGENQAGHLSDSQLLTVVLGGRLPGWR